MNFYNPQAQGFGVAPGGVPNQGIPFIPDVEHHPRVSHLLPALAARLFEDMQHRNNASSQFLTGQYAKNGFNNQFYTVRLGMAIGYVDYLIHMMHQPETTAVMNAAMDINDAAIHVECSRHRHLVEQTGFNEMDRCKNVFMKLENLKPKIREYLEMNNTYTTAAPQQFQQPIQYQNQNPMGYQPQMNYQPQPQMGMANPINQQYASARYQQPVQPQINPYTGQPIMPQPVMQQPMMGQFPPAMMQQQFPQPAAYPTARMNPAQMAMGFPQPMMQQPMMQQQYQPQPQYNSPAYQSSVGITNAFAGTQGQPSPYQENLARSLQGADDAIANQRAAREMIASQSNSAPMVGFTKLEPVDVNAAANNNTQTATATNANNGVFNPAKANANGEIVFNGKTYYTLDNVLSRPLPPHHRVDDMGDVYIHNRLSMPRRKHMDECNTVRRVLETNDVRGKGVLQKNMITKLHRDYNVDMRELNNATFTKLTKALTRCEPNNPLCWSNTLQEWDDYNSNARIGNTTSQVTVDHNKHSEIGLVSADESDVIFESDFESFDEYLIAANKKAKDVEIKSSLLGVQTNANGEFTWSNGKTTEVLKQPGTGLPIKMATPSQTSNAPYPFAKRNAKGEWVVYEEDYDKIKGEKFPHMLVTDGTREVRYIVDDNGDLESYFVTPANFTGDDMDYERHDCRKFFSPQTLKDEKTKVDAKLTNETFANIQTAFKVQEVVQQIEELSNTEHNEELVLDGITIELNNQVDGDLVHDDYFIRSVAALSEELEQPQIDKLENASVRYRHVSMLPWVVTSEDDIEELLRLKKAKSYSEIVDLINEFHAEGVLIDSYVTKLNQLATNYINYLLKVKFSTGLWITNFLGDIQEVQEYFDNIGKGEKFAETYRELLDTVFNVYTNNNVVFGTYHGLDETDKPDTAGFGIVRDVTVIPVTAAQLSLKSKSESFVLSKDAFPALWEVANNRMQNPAHKALEVLIVTKDNRVMSIGGTSNPELFVVTNKSILEFTP